MLVCSPFIYQPQTRIVELLMKERYEFASALEIKVICSFATTCQCDCICVTVYPDIQMRALANQRQIMVGHNSSFLCFKMKLYILLWQSITHGPCGLDIPVLTNTGVKISVGLHICWASFMTDGNIFDPSDLIWIDVPVSVYTAVI